MSSQQYSHLLCFVSKRSVLSDCNQAWSRSEREGGGYCSDLSGPHLVSVICPKVTDCRSKDSKDILINFQLNQVIFTLRAHELFLDKKKNNAGLKQSSLSQFSSFFAVIFAEIHQSAVFLCLSWHV